MATAQDFASARAAVIKAANEERDRRIAEETATDIDDEEAETARKAENAAASARFDESVRAAKERLNASVLELAKAYLALRDISDDAGHRHDFDRTHACTARAFADVRRALQVDPRWAEALGWALKSSWDH